LEANEDRRIDKDKLYSILNRIYFSKYGERYVTSSKKYIIEKEIPLILDMILEK
jgi:hypothetical protein